MKLWAKSRTLLKPIGGWMVPSSQLYCEWSAYYEFSNSCLYVKQCDRYIQYNPDKENIHLFVNGKDSKRTLTDTSAPAHICRTDGMVTIGEVDCSGEVGDDQVQQDGTFQMYLDIPEDWESSLLQNVHTLQPLCKIFDTMGEEAFITSTDDSSGYTLMSFGWKISDSEGKMLVQHAGPAFGQASSFWSEVYGILSVALFLHYTKEYVQYKEQVSFMLYLDN
eukprot:15349422-Ditylum_brightwellii.AAC.1